MNLVTRQSQGQLCSAGVSKVAPQRVNAPGGRQEAAKLQGDVARDISLLATSCAILAG